MKKITKVKLFTNPDKKSQLVAKKIKKELLTENIEINDYDYQLAISIGGDGCFLKMIKENKFNSDITYIGINSGTLGFLQEIDLKDTTNFVKRLKNNDYKIEELSFEENIIFDDNRQIIYNSLNEIVIRKKDFSIFKADILIDNELLEEFSGDGILISTSTGSTAYNMSFHGPIIYNSLDTLVLTPIAPLNNRVYSSLSNPIIIPNNKEILVKPKNKNIFVMIDGEIKEFNNISHLIIKSSNNKIKCLRMNNYHFIKIVNNKLINKKHIK